MLISNLVNLGVYNEVCQILKESGKDIVQIEEFEPEPSLGNGGLGRLRMFLRFYSITRYSWYSY